MKLIRICSFVFLMIGLNALGYADEQFPFLAEVSKESVNIRAGANTNFEKLDKLSRGAEVVVLGKSFEWYKVQLPTTAKAYIRADYLKIHENSTAELIGDKVNIRADANSTSSSIGFLKQGDLVKVTVQVNGWWQIEPPLQAMGWIREDFLTLKSSKVDHSLIKKPLSLVEDQSLNTIEVKGVLKALTIPKNENIHYKLIMNDKTYYLQCSPDIKSFEGTVVTIKGIIVSDSSHQYDYPILGVVSISLLL